MPGRIVGIDIRSGAGVYPFSAGSFAPRNSWDVAAFGNEIGEQPLSRWILNQPVVLYRKKDGHAIAVEGRCPRRRPRSSIERPRT